MRQRAWLYASFHKPQGTSSLPISRTAIQEATSINRRSQQRFDKITTIRVANYACRQDASGEITPLVEIVDGKSRQWKIHKRFGNTYYCRARRGSTGMLRKLRTASRQSCIRDEACRLKRFFTTARSYIKCPHKHDDPYIIVLADRRVTRKMEWCQANP